MEFLASIQVGKPLNIFLVAAVFFVGYLVLRLTGIGSQTHPRALLVVAAAWVLYGLWEWLVQARTPEANIRVDLMVIWPLLLIVSVWFTIRAFR